MKAIFPVLLAISLIAVPPARAGFTQELQFGSTGTIPVAWGDYNGDGFADLSVGNYQGQNELYSTDGTGTFTQSVEFGNRNTFALVWGDFDNDGDPDLAVGNNGGWPVKNQLYMNNGDSTFTWVNRFGLTSGTIALAWADCDLDGDLDMAAGNGILGSVEQNQLFINNGDSTFTEQAQFGTGQSCTIAWGDYDNDGDPDLAVGNGGFNYVGQNYLYINNGDGTYTEEAQFGSGDTSSLVWGDSDNDGDLDLAVGNWNDGQNYLYINNGDGTFTEQAQFGARDPNTIAWGDYDNDGDLDLAVGNGDFTSADSNFIYRNDGAGAFAEIYEFGLGSTDGIAWADYDNDGDLDLAVGNEHHPFENWLYVNDINDSASLQIALLGHSFDFGTGYSNREGIGAKVTVYNAGFIGDPAHRLGYREVCAHGGFSSQNQIEAHFGLPGETTVDVRVEWPGSGGSSLTDEYIGVEAKGKVTLEEGSTFTGISGGESIDVGNLQFKVMPNPMRGETRLSMQLPAGNDAGNVEIYSVGGRLVRTLRPAASGSRGSYHSQWDGRDSKGAPLPSGVYFASLRGIDTTTRRIVLLR